MLKMKLWCIAVAITLTIVSAAQLSDLFASFYNGDKKDKKSGNNVFELTPDQLTAFLNSFKQNSNSNQQATTQKSVTKQDDGNINSQIGSGSSKGKSNRRHVLYDLSVSSHYEKLMHDEEQTKLDKTTIPTTSTSEYWNEGMQQSSLFNVREIATKNEGSIFSRGSHWTYRFTPQQQLSQLHLEPSTIPENVDEVISKPVETLKLPPTSILSNSIHFVIPTVHNLGTFLPPWALDYNYIVNNAWGSKEIDSPIPQGVIVEYYTDGDICKGTQKRQSKVIYSAECCERSRQSMLEELFQNDGNIMIQEVFEPVPCRYIVKACNTCPDEKEKKEEAANSTDTADQSSSSSTVDPSEFDHLIQTYLQGTSSSDALPPMPPSQIEANKQLLQSMFMHAYDSYFYNAFPAGELKPLTCEPGTFSLVRVPALTLIDTLDTFIIMGNYTEFARSVERLRFLDERMKEEFQAAKGSGKKKSASFKLKGEEGGLFSVNTNVSLFETTIRVLGGLLSAHQLAIAYMSNVVIKTEVWGFDGEVLNSTSSRTNDKDNGAPLNADNGGASSQCVWEETDAQECASNNNENIQSTDNMWQYDGYLLELAHDIGKRLLFAFDTETGIPYGTVNLLHGVPKGETTVASLAGAGTLTLEFELLSRLTSDKSFGKAAKLATRALWIRGQPQLHLYGKHIDTKSGAWKEYLSGVGSNSDSFYEYLIKHYLLFPEDEEFWTMFSRVYSGVHDNSRLGEWYVDVDLNHGLSGHVRQVFESLMAFYPGLQVLVGELAPSAATLNSFFLVREYLGLLPERFNFVHWKTEGVGDVHPLRPELLESCYFLHLATLGLHGNNRGPCSKTNSTHHTSSWLWAANFALHAVHKLSMKPCGFATVSKVGPSTTGLLDFVGSNRDPQTEQRVNNIQHHNEMPSYFLSETIKYLWLTFDAEHNILHNDNEREWIFTTEAHPIHYVPIAETDQDDRISTQIEQVRLLLQERLSPSTETDTKDELEASTAVLPAKEVDSTKESIVPSFEHEKWSTKTQESIYAAAIHERNQVVVASKHGNNLQSGPPFQSASSLLASDDAGIFSSEIEGKNQAHHQFDRHGKGNGNKLGRSCPNYHHPDMQWAMALHGSSLDYNTAHRSLLTDILRQKDAVDERMNTALSSACFYGTAFYPNGIKVDESKSCPNIPDATSSKENPTKKDKIQYSTNAQIPGSTRYDMGAPLGEFDVSSFPGGDGFIVRHIDSGEVIEVSIFHSLDQLTPSIVLVVQTAPFTQMEASTVTTPMHYQTLDRSTIKLGKGGLNRGDKATLMDDSTEDDITDGYQRHVVGELIYRFVCILFG